jgi:hypothetical protein
VILDAEHSTSILSSNCISQPKIVNSKCKNYQKVGQIRSICII